MMKKMSKMPEDFLTNALAARPTAVALGIFDGVHIGHRAVLKEAANSGATKRAPSIIRPWKKSVQQTAEKPPKKV